MRVELPSGMTLEMRPWSLGDMGEMAIRASQPNAGDALLFDAVSYQHVETIDPGPYPSVQVGDAKFDWARILKADVLWALYRIRAASFPDDPAHGLTGEDYQFPYRCPDPACEGHKIETTKTVRLCDLRVRKLPSASAAVMRSGASFETRVAGRVVKYVLPTFALDAPLREHLKRERKATRNPKRPTTPAEDLASQVVFIEGVKNSDKDLAVRAKWLGALSVHDWAPFRDELIRAAPVIGNRIDSVCDVCGRVTTSGLPLAQGFFAPLDRSEELLEEDEAETMKATGTTEETKAPTDPPTPSTTSATST